jgi:serine phosphatase RsbU (regulator of sigma subunit)
MATLASRLEHETESPELLTCRALRWLEMYLRTQDPSKYRGIKRETFVTSLVLAVYRGLDPSRGRKSNPSPNSTESTLEGYEVRAYSQPVERVGGDWWAHADGPERLLWVIVADVTGHGYPAYLLAAGLPHLWQSVPISKVRNKSIEPRELLEALGRELESVLPADLFVEAVLGRFDFSGEATLAAAGACRPILRRARVSRLEFHALGGCFLGLEGGGRDQCSWRLEEGDELLLATDGLFDQPIEGQERLSAKLRECSVPRLSADRCLHEAIIEIVSEALEANRQHDDITVITLRRRDRLQIAGSHDAGM